MTIFETIEFRAEFASIVHWHGMIKSQSGALRRLESYNKSGSHDDAILKAIDVFKMYKSKLKEKLKGKSYEEWRIFSSNLSAIKGKLKRSVNDATKAKWQAEIDNLEWSPPKEATKIKPI